MSAAAKKRGRLWRWTKRFVLVAVVAVVLLRVALGLALPWIVDRAGAAAGLDLAYEDLSLSLLGGRVELWGLEAWLAPDGEPSEGSARDALEAAFTPGGSYAQEAPFERLGRLQYLVVDVDVSALFTGELRVHRVEVDGLDAWATRNQAGDWNFAALGGEPSEPDEDEPDDDSDDESGAIELGSPLAVRAIRAQHLRLHLRDESLEPARVRELELQLAISDVGSHERPTRLTLWAAGDGLAGLRITGSGSSAGPRLVANLDLDLRGLRPGVYARELAALGIEPVAETLALHASLAVDVDAAEGAGADSDEGATAVGVRARLADFALLADGAEELAVDAVELHVPVLGDRALDLETAVVSGVRGRAHRRADGALEVAGVALVPTGPDGAADDAADGVDESADAVASAEVEDSDPEADPEGDREPFTLRAARVAIEAGHFVFTDDAVVPSAELELALERLAVQELVLDPARRDVELTLEGSLAAPGLFEHLVLSGVATPFAATRTFALDVELGGLDPERAEGWLAAAGLTSTLTEGRLVARVQGAATIDERGTRLAAELADVVLSDRVGPDAENPLDAEGALTESGERILFALETVALDELVLDKASDTTRITSLEVRGLRLPLARDAAGSLHVAGVRTRLEPAPQPTADAPAAQPLGDAVADADPHAAGEADGDGGAEARAAGVAAADGGADDAPRPRLIVEHVAFDDALVTWRDDRASEPVALEVADLRLALDGLVLGGDPDAPAPDPARFEVSLSSAGLAERLALAGAIRSRPGPLDLDGRLELEGTGLSLAPLRAYLVDLGIESELEQGALGGELAFTVREEGERGGGGALALSAELADFGLTGGGTTWAAIERFAVPSVRIDDAGTAIDELVLAGVRLVVRRTADGALEFAQTRFGGAAAEDAPSAASDAGGRGEPGVAAAAEGGGDSAAEAAPANGSGSALRLGRLAIEDLRLAFADDAVEPAFATELTLAAEVVDLVLGAEATGARFEVRIAATDVLESLTLVGTAQPDPAELDLDARLELVGLDGASLASYLPPGTTLAVDDGRAELALRARSEVLAGGGRSAAVELVELKWRDGAEGEPFLLLERLAFVAPELGVQRDGDPSARYVVRELVLEGLEFAAARTSPTTVETLGLRIVSSDEASSPNSDVDPGDPDQVGSDQGDPAVAGDPAEPDRVEDGVALAAPATAEQAAAPAASGGAVARMAHAETLAPTVIVERLDIGIDRFRFEDRTRSAAEPLVASLHLVLPEPTTLLAPEPEEIGSTVLELTGRADSIGALDARLTLDAWVAEPRFDLALSLSELSGSGLLAAVPELADRLGAGELEGGSFETSLDGTLRLRRRGPTDFDLAAGFGVELVLGETAWRAQPDGPVLFGVERIDVDVTRIQPREGGVHVAEVEIVRPTLRARQAADGLHVLGLTLLAQADEAEPRDAADAEASALPEETATEAVADVSARSAPKPELRIDRLSVLGLDLDFTDETVEPTFALPIVDLELLVERFSTLMFEEERQFQFRAALYGGEHALPAPLDRGSLLGGLLRRAGNVASAGQLLKSGERELVERRIFDEIAIAGRLAPFPAPKGWVKLEVSALELLAFAGPASEAGVTIRDGLLDAAAEVRLRGSDGLSLVTASTFDRLSLTEPPGGPISRVLALPAPLDTVLFALNNEDGEIVIPLSLRVPAGGVSARNVAQEVTRTLGVLITEAISASPMRIVGGALDLAKLRRESGPVELDGETRTIAFPPGQAAFTEAAWREATAPLVELLRENDELGLVVQHELGAGDYAVAGLLANPAPDDLRALGDSLRARKTELGLERDALVIDARRSLALGDRDRTAELATRLAAVESELGSTERALDDVLELLRPGAERRAPKRAQAACRAIAELRLRATREALLRLPVPRIAQRIDVRRARIELPSEPTDAESAPHDESAGSVAERGGGRVTLTPRAGG